LHAGHLAQRFPEFVGSADDGVLDHLQRHTPGGNCRLSAGFEHTQGLDHPVMAFGCDGALAGEGCVCSVLGIQVIVLTTLTATMLVWCRDLQNFDVGVLHVTQMCKSMDLI
jgi:hypothetical protein